MHASTNKFERYLSERISPQETYSDLLRFPRYIEVETVNVCNARCPMCTIDDWERGSKPISDEIFKKVADEIIANADQVNRVSLYRDGEPLIDKKMPDRIATLKQGGVKNVGISTNVSLLTEQKAKDLLNAGIDTIIFSIDSLQKEIYESIRVRLKFEQVLENALRFIELRNQIRPQTKIWIRMIRQESNKNEWPEYEKFWRSKVAPHDRVYFHNIFNWGGQLDNFKAISSSFEPNLPCVALWSLFVIFSNGDVPLCNVDYNNKFPTGSILTHSIQELWQSKIMNERRVMHLTGQKSCISICQNCNVWDESPDLKGISAQYGGSAVELQA